MTPHDAGPNGPSAGVRRVITLVIALHFFAILTTLVGTGNRRFPAPELVAWLRHTTPIEVYLQSLFLTSPYRFYAPDPGPTTLLWFKVRYADGNVRWVELAEREAYPLRTSFQRHMSLPLLLDWAGLYPDAADSRKVLFTEEGKVCTSSFVRHVARSNRRADDAGRPIPVSWVTAYMVYHQVLQPYQIRMNWDSDDLRLYSQTYLGVYAPSGARSEDPFGKVAYTIPFNSYVLAEFLLQHAAPLLDGVPPAERPGKLAPLGLPLPWRKVLERYPELLNDLPPLGTDDDPKAQRDAIERLQRYIEAKVVSRDTPPPGAPAIAASAPPASP